MALAHIGARMAVLGFGPDVIAPLCEVFGRYPLAAVLAYIGSDFADYLRTIRQWDGTEFIALTDEVLNFEERALGAATGVAELPAVFRQGLAIAQLMDGSAEQVVRLLIELYEAGAAQQLQIDELIVHMEREIVLLRLRWELRSGEKLSFEQFAATMRADFLLSAQAMPADDELADPPLE